MNVDTAAIRRLRDHLLARSATPAGRGVAAATLRRVEPFAETMFLVMGADGELAPVEHEAMLAALSMLTDGALSPEDLANLLERFERNLAVEGRDGRLANIGAWLSRDRDDRETAFALAAVMAMADDRVELGENQALELVREYFGVSARRVGVILDALD